MMMKSLVFGLLAAVGSAQTTSAPTMMPSPAPSMMMSEIRTYQSRMNVSFFPEDRPAPPGAEVFVVTYVIEGSFMPQSFATMKIVSYFEPFAFSICDPTAPFVLTSVEHAEVAISSDYVIHSTILPVPNMTQMAPPFAGVSGSIITGTKLDPVTDTMQYTAANMRILDDDPYRPAPEEVAVAALESDTFYMRVPNFEECPEIGLNP